MTPGDEQNPADQKSQQAFATETGKSQQSTDESHSNSQPEQAGMFKWTNAVTRRCWQNICWLAHQLNANNGVVTAIATVAIGIVAWLQWETFEKTDRTLNRTLLIGQRAFVHLEEINFQVVDKWSENEECCIFILPRKEGRVIKTEFKLTNNGNTPTKNLKIRIQCQPMGLGTKISDPFELFKWNDPTTISRSLGAKQTIPVSPESCEIKPDDTLLNAQMRTVKRFFLGEITYEDWIEPGHLHRTRFVHELIARAPAYGDGLPGHDAFTGAVLATNPVGTNNCTDEDCPQ
jgi:hypothetical protein